jgi:hypothetical protein
MTLDAIPLEKRGDLRIDFASHHALRITNADHNDHCNRDNDFRVSRTNHESLKPAMLVTVV